MRMMCPHCNEHAYTRTSLQLTSTSRETIFQCRNFECGQVFSAVTEINRTRSEEHTSELQSQSNLVCRIIRSEEHTSELQSQSNLVCRLLLEKKNTSELHSQSNLG